MTETPPHIARAARRAALAVERMVIEMLLERKTGKATIEVSRSGLTPIKQIDDEGPFIKIAMGQGSTIETAK